MTFIAGRRWTQIYLIYADFLFIICGYLRLSASEMSEIIKMIYEIWRIINDKFELQKLKDIKENSPGHVIGYAQMKIRQ